MKNVNVKELREKSDAELKTEISRLKEELFRLRLRKVTDVIESSAVLGNIRRDVARVNTIVKERELAAAKKIAAEKKKKK